MLSFAVKFTYVKVCLKFEIVISIEILQIFIQMEKHITKEVIYYFLKTFKITRSKKFQSLVRFCYAKYSWFEIKNNLKLKRITVTYLMFWNTEFIQQLLVKLFAAAVDIVFKNKIPYSVPNWEHRPAPVLRFEQLT